MKKHLIKPEQKLWHDLQRPLQRYGHARRVENALDPGMPDISFCFLKPPKGRVRGLSIFTENEPPSGREGFLELKAIARWPLKEVHVAVDVRPAQRLWWLERSSVGGRVLVLLWVVEAGEYLLFEGGNAGNCLGHLQKEELRDLASRHWMARPGGGAKAGALSVENIVDYVLER